MSFLQIHRAEPPRSNLSVKTDRQGDQVRVSVSGQITIDSAADLRAMLLEWLNDPACRILHVDLFGVAYVDTSGLAVLVEMLRAARALGKRLELGGVQDRPLFLLEATRLLPLFNTAARP